MNRNRGIRAGKLFGIEVRLDYSWFVLFFLVALSFIVSLLPASYPEFSILERVFIGLISAVLLFLSVVTHEFAHSLYAKSKGLKIDRITLFIFGGAAELKTEPTSPRQEFIMAAVGPLMSLLISFGFGLVMVIGLVTGLVYLVAVGSILAAVNLVLAVFNLLPGFPLDGGRMFRAIIWKITNNYIKATRIATGTGKFFAYLLMAYGLMQLIVFGALGGIWLIFIGLFLSAVATASYKQALVQTLLKEVRVTDLMNRSHTAVPGKTKARDFLQKYVMRYKQSSLPIESADGKSAGIISASDISESDLDTPVKELAHDKNYIVHPSDTALRAYEIMSRTGLQTLPVIENSKIVGTLSVNNLEAYLDGKQRLT